MKLKNKKTDKIIKLKRKPKVKMRTKKGAIASKR